MTTFGQRVRAALDEFGPLCVGIDPHTTLLDAWGLDVSAQGAGEFGLRVVDAAAGRAGIVKPQVAFFERFGSAGYAALERVLAAARAAGLIVIADAKRGDIDTTMDGYADAWLGAGSPLEADAVTLSPYLGPDSLHKTLASAVRSGKGAFVLAATSNREGLPVQTAEVVDGAASDRERVAERVARDVGSHNIGLPGSLGSIGVVVGATVDRAAYGLSDIVLAGTPILAPGFGAQGAQAGDLPKLFGYVASGVIASESRSILAVGADRVAARISERAAAYREALGG
ncbi:MAG: orotidine-5'-phosphate decarboxylase [Microbacterium sp.]|uniref:orotidine-5'-phosphate decarboxylase n=2 Tax=Microbacterium sp. TaxID=51671 RepID=UPI001AC85942|nr:orotidine-5'-phosphate decarboxylase [Microbacterium sp.]MBN9152665.1 orotidine-5'-phosphate decarboxylase [Microbacterium sp.]MBN9190201.1 orotidine-5'-phosphate decarboxylase [Microbacterium sp.]